MDLVTLAQTLDAHGVRFRSQPQFGNASVVLVGSDAAAFEKGMRSMFFSSNDVLADFPAPVVAAAPVAVAPQIAEAVTVAIVKPDVPVMPRKPTLVDETRAKLRQLFPSGRGPELIQSASAAT